MSAGGERHSGYCQHDHPNRHTELCPRCADESTIVALRRQLADAKESLHLQGDELEATRVERDAAILRAEAAEKEVAALTKEIEGLHRERSDF